MYSVRILRRAIKDIADLPKDYARVVSLTFPDSVP